METNRRPTWEECAQVLTEEEQEKAQAQYLLGEVAIEFYHCWAGSWSRSDPKEKATVELWKQVDSKRFNETCRAAIEFVTYLESRGIVEIKRDFR